MEVRTGVVVSTGVAEGVLTSVEGLPAVPPTTALDDSVLPSVVGGKLELLTSTAADVPASAVDPTGVLVSPGVLDGVLMSVAVANQVVLATAVALSLIHI